MTTPLAEAVAAYEEARAEVQRVTTDQFGVQMHDDCFTSLKVGTLRAFLAGPPEPSEEEVARVLYMARGGTSEAYDVEAGGMTVIGKYPIHNRVVQARFEARAVQALYRSKRHG